MIGNKKLARPFLKWAGGKTQLLSIIENSLPKSLKERKFTFVEPFIGSGAVFFWFMRNYPSIRRAIINDVNKDLTDTYSTIKNYPEDLITALKQMEVTYKSLEKTEAQKEYFLERRREFNSRKGDLVGQSALMIFLNRTCFNGLYRVNSKNEFNVPFGQYANPIICDRENILNVSACLANVEILNGDYSLTLKEVEGDCFFYFDPPYKPLSSTASFNSYARDDFNDNEQERLKSFCDVLDKKHIDWLLSNSDPKNTDPDNHFFDELYAEYYIDRVKAKRMINSVASKRGEIYELLIHNYVTQNAPAMVC